MVCVSCGDDGPSSAARAVQLHDVRVAPSAASCSAPGAAGEFTYSLVFTFNIINTTDQEVRVTKARTSGVVIRATRESDLGQPAHTFPSLPIEASQLVVPAKVGDVPMTVRMTAGCGTAPVTSIYSKDIQTTLIITTETGEYSSTPQLVIVEWRPRVG